VGVTPSVSLCSPAPRGGAISSEKYLPNGDPRDGGALTQSHDRSGCSFPDGAISSEKYLPSGEGDHEVVVGVNNLDLTLKIFI